MKAGFLFLLIGFALLIFAPGNSVRTELCYGAQDSFFWLKDFWTLKRFYWHLRYSLTLILGCEIILFVPIILPSAVALGISPIILGLIIIVTLALGLVTPPYGLCLLLACSISGTTIEDGFKGTLPYFLSSVVVLILLVIFPEFWLAIPKAVFPALF